MPTGDSITITKFSEENPTRCYCSDADAAKLAEGDLLIATSFTPDDPARVGISGIVTNLRGRDFQLVGFDFSGIQTDGISAIAMVGIVPPDEAGPPVPYPSPGHGPDLYANPIYPSPGQGPLAV